MSNLTCLHWKIWYVLNKTFLWNPIHLPFYCRGWYIICFMLNLDEICVGNGLFYRNFTIPYGGGRFCLGSHTIISPSRAIIRYSLGLVGSIGRLWSIGRLLSVWSVGTLGSVVASISISIVITWVLRAIRISWIRIVSIVHVQKKNKRIYNVIIKKIKTNLKFISVNIFINKFIWLNFFSHWN